MKSKLILMPVPISEPITNDWIGPDFQSIIQSSRLFFVENVRTARRFISSLKLPIKIDDLQFEVVDKSTTLQEIERMVHLLDKSKIGVLMSESGCPGVADPGAALVDRCHANG